MTSEKIRTFRIRRGDKLIFSEDVPVVRRGKFFFFYCPICGKLRWAKMNREDRGKTLIVKCKACNFEKTIPNPFFDEVYEQRLRMWRRNQKRYYKKMGGGITMGAKAEEERIATEGQIRGVTIVRKRTNFFFICPRCGKRKRARTVVISSCAGTRHFLRLICRTCGLDHFVLNPFYHPEGI